jgi:Uma2 family endonuclease
VVCDPSKLYDYGHIGGPEMVIGILSPSTKKHDTMTKYELYRRAEVKEYWIVDPDSRTVEQCILKNKEYVVKKNDETAVIDVNVLKGCKIDMNLVFADMD